MGHYAVRGDQRVVVWIWIRPLPFHIHKHPTEHIYTRYSLLLARWYSHYSPYAGPANISSTGVISSTLVSIAPTDLARPVTNLDKALVPRSTSFALVASPLPDLIVYDLVNGLPTQKKGGIVALSSTNGIWTCEGASQLRGSTSYSPTT